MSLRVISQPSDDVIRVLARQVGAEVAMVGSVRVIGPIDPSEVVVSCGRVRRLSKEQLEQVLDLIGNTGSRGGVVDADGVVVIVDRLQNVRRFFDTVATLETVESATWSVQLHLVRATENYLRNLGFNVAPAVDVSASTAIASAAGVTTPASWTALANIKASLQAAETDGRGLVLANPVFLVTDGEPLVYEQGGRLSVRSTTATPSAGGPVQTSSLQQLPYGLRLDLIVRELSNDRARLRLIIDRTRVEETGDNPRFTTDHTESVTDVVSGGLYLLQHSVESTREEATGKGLAAKLTASRERRVWQVWASVHRIAVGGPRSPAAEGASTRESAVPEAAGRSAAASAVKSGSDPVSLPKASGSQSSLPGENHAQGKTETTKDIAPSAGVELRAMPDLPQAVRVLPAECVPVL